VRSGACVWLVGQVGVRVRVKVRLVGPPAQVQQQTLHVQHHGGLIAAAPVVGVVVVVVVVVVGGAFDLYG
jgi:hypothetical protein